jgi:hypothetical protein
MHACRLAALEEAEQRRREPFVVVVRGGLDGVGDGIAIADGAHFTQAPNETFEAFKTRVVSEATLARAVNGRDDELIAVFGTA